MIRRIPIIPTLLVLAGVSTMIGLGVWQLHRKQWKEGLIAQYQAARAGGGEVSWPTSPAELESALFYRSRVDCLQVTGFDALSGRSSADQPGWSHIAHCRLRGGGTAEVALGWSNGPAQPAWSGGEVTGWVTEGLSGARLVADPPQAGLAPLERAGPPDPTPMGHLSYALQWFAFAFAATVTYALALRKRLAGTGARG
ncbi:MAG: SURF1 family protein [Sphingomonadales bacterium]|nr:SURF1 family protein [Sphingomonadales bacterium]MDE2568548.1 SURF1 family protein [Sphingomonadales bacterium]